MYRLSVKSTSPPICAMTRRDPMGDLMGDTGQNLKIVVYLIFLSSPLHFCCGA